jgi:hypothetical protein
MENLELRMYGFVPYNISEIQKGIQFGHGVVEYSLIMDRYPGLKEQYIDWALNHKTFIILNGGTTNNDIKDGLYVGGLNQIAGVLNNLKIVYSRFYEPDLNGALTSINFIIDERIFNTKKYPEPEEPSEKEMLEFIQTIGGDRNYELRNFLKNYRLA